MQYVPVPAITLFHFDSLKVVKKGFDVQALFTMRI